MKTQAVPQKIYYHNQELTELLSLLKRHRIQPKKRLGQTFLFKRFIAEEIVRLLEITPHDTVVEIGAGLGVLTTLLAEQSAKVIALEYDSALVSILQKTMAHKNVDIIRADALNFDYRKVFSRSQTKIKIIGNLPYYITSPLLFKLFKLKSMIEVLVVMIQKEVADRIVAPPGTRDYGTISIFSQLFSDVSKQLTVTKECFYPPPQVDSEVVKFIIYQTPLVEVKDENFFEKLVRVSFSQRRKTLLNCLKSAHYFNRGKQEILTALECSGINPQRRAETLTIKEFNSLCQQIASIKPLLPR